MNSKYLFSFFVLILLNFISKGYTISPSDRICGRWESTEKNLIVQVYREENKFIAKIVWFNANDGKAMESWTDRNNPNEALRNRKILGMSVLTDLIYKENSNSWENGMIYDAKHGHEWKLL